MFNLPFIVVLAIFASFYLFLAGVIQKNFKPWRVSQCYNCSNGRSCSLDHSGAAFFAGILWPLALPMSLGLYGTAILGMGHGGKSRAERRREEELAEVTHRRNIAQMEAQATEALERSALGRK